MLINIPDVLTQAQIAHMLKVLDQAGWGDGRATAGPQSALAKHNLQLPETAPEARELGAIVLEALKANPTFVSAALPLRVFPPLFNRYDEGMDFGPHVDNAIRFSQTTRFRIDLSATLFLSDPEDYDGGELVIQGAMGDQAIKLPAGAMVLYPATTLHSVRPITRGRRCAAFFWVQSMVRQDGQRDLLFQMDQSIQSLSSSLGADEPNVIALTGGYHNLIRMWAEV